MSGRRLEIVGWEKFQHYSDRDPIWIKNYVDLLRRDEYMDLTPNRRALLHGLWLLYAIKRREVRENTATLSRELNMKVTRRDLKALEHAGFIALAASKTLAGRYQPASPEKEVEKELEAPPTPPAVREVLAGEEEFGFERADAVARLLAVLKDKNEKTEVLVWGFAKRLPAPSIHKVRDSTLDAIQDGRIESSVSGYAVNALRGELEDRAVA